MRINEKGEVKHCRECVNNKATKRREKRKQIANSKGLDLNVDVNCSTCQQNKPAIDFYISHDNSNGLTSACKQCSNRRDRERRKLRPELFKNSQLKRNYGITLDDYYSLCEAQNNCCAICKNIVDKLFVDHCHNSGKIRGLLCPQCNLGLGAFKDNPNYLNNAMDYLEHS